MSHLPPDETDILEALIQSEGVPLTVHSLCHEIAGSAADKTIGRYVSGLLATHARGGKNEISINVQESLDDKDWLGTVVFLSGDDENPYYWGVEFLVRHSDGLVLPSSFRCFIPWY